MDNSSYSRTKPSGNKNTVDDEVRRLFKKNKGNVDANEFVKLRSKYDNQELVDQIQTLYLEKHQKIVKRAKKFATLIREKYSNSNYPFHVLLEKAHKFKQKHGLSEEEFSEFKRIYEQELVGVSSPDVVRPTTNMMKVLGTMNTGFEGPKFKVSDTDYKHLQEILKLHSVSRPLHAQVMLQSIQYTDCSYEAVSGEYKKELGQRPGEHVHPVIAALFFPKIQSIEDHFIYANMANIVKSRYQEEALTSRPDYELFYALVSDPNDVVCNNTSPVIDLLNRCNVQQQLWNSVLHLRNGQYYNTAFREFVSAIDVCRLNKYDNPDLIYGRHDGTVIKRLLSTFSFRPTVVATSSVHQMFSTNPYNQTIRPVVTTVPMINLRLPMNLTNNSAVNLNDALSQYQYFLEGASVVPKHTDLIYSRGVLIFYVDRRSHVMRVHGAAPFNMGALPQALAGFERLNDRKVTFDDVINIRGDRYDLRSVVLSEVNKSIPNQNIVIGSSTAVMSHADPAAGKMRNEYFLYNPAGVIDFQPNAAGGNPQNGPITQINGAPGIGQIGHSFEEMATDRGCIFVYQLAIDQTNGMIAM
jgi:hypothetical protein|uniref:P4B major core protein n=1 Tax=viral metagenome TaxID=1070528 RepID=A0A6C0IV91_9ZZZZ